MNSIRKTTGISHYFDVVIILISIIIPFLLVRLTYQFHLIPILLFLAGVGIYKIWSKQNWHSLGLEWRCIWGGVLASIILVLVTKSYIGLAFPFNWITYTYGFNFSEWFIRTFWLNTFLIFLYTLIGVEFVFRGGLLSSLLEKLSISWALFITTLVSSICISIYPIYQQGFYQISPLIFIFGKMFCYNLISGLLYLGWRNIFVTTAFMGSILFMEQLLIADSNSFYQTRFYYSSSNMELYILQGVMLVIAVIMTGLMVRKNLSPKEEKIESFEIEGTHS